MRSQLRLLSLKTLLMSALYKEIEDPLFDEFEQPRHRIAFLCGIAINNSLLNCVYRLRGSTNLYEQIYEHGKWFEHRSKNAVISAGITALFYVEKHKINAFYRCRGPPNLWFFI